MKTCACLLIFATATYICLIPIQRGHPLRMSSPAMGRMWSRSHIWCCSWYWQRFCTVSGHPGRRDGYLKTNSGQPLQIVARWVCWAIPVRSRAPPGSLVFRCISPAVLHSIRFWDISRLLPPFLWSDKWVHEWVFCIRFKRDVQLPENGSMPQGLVYRIQLLKWLVWYKWYTINWFGWQNGNWPHLLHLHIVFFWHIPVLWYSIAANVVTKRVWHCCCCQI